MRRLILAVGIVLVATLAALFTVPALVDWGRFRGRFEDEASRLLGRPVRVGDRVALQLLPTPFISFDNVRVADASGRFDTPLLRAESFRLQLAVGPLLTGAIVAQDVEIRGAAIRLAISPDGRGNWAGLWPALRTATGASTALWASAVRFNGGTIELLGERPNQRLKVEGLIGDLDSPAIAGPYRFKGRVSAFGQPLELRLSAGSESGTNGVRIKAHAFREGPDARSYTADGVLGDLESSPRFTGSLEADLPWGKPVEAEAGGSSGVTRIQARADADATAASVTLKDIAVALDSAGRPQRITGRASLNVNGTSTTGVTDLQTSWLDLDQIAGAGVRSAPRVTLAALAARLSQVTPLLGGTQLRLTVDEAQLGGGTVDKVQIVAAGSSEGIDFDRISARLPGQGLLEAKGRLLTGEEPGFRGQFRLWGSNLDSLLIWAAPSLGLKPDPRADSYLIDSTVSLSGKTFDANPLRVEVSGTTITGKLRRVASDPPILDVTLDSNRLDVRQLLETPIGTLLLAGEPAADGSQNADSAGIRSLLAGDARLDLHIGHLLTGEGSLRDVTARLDRNHGRLIIPGVDVSTDEGLSLHLEGALETSGTGAGRGQLRVVTSAVDWPALAGAARLAGIGDALAPYQKPLSALTPISLAGTIEFGDDSGTSDSVALEGQARDSGFALHLRRTGSDTDLMSSQVELSADLRNGNADALLRQVAEGAGSAFVASGEASPAELRIRLSGVPQRGLKASAKLASVALKGSFDGTLGLAGNPSLSGKFSVNAHNGEQLVRLAHLDPLASALQGSPLQLTATANFGVGQAQLADIVASVAGHGVGGQATLAWSGPVPSLQAGLRTDFLRLDGLLSELVQRGNGGPNGAEPTAPGDFWPSSPIDFAVLDPFRAAITVAAGKLIFARDIAVANADLGLESNPGHLNLTLRDGQTMGGRASATARLDKAPAGASFALDADLKGWRLDLLAASGARLPAPQGELAASFKISSQGLSPRDLAAYANGSGTFAVSQGDILGLSPGLVDTAVRATLTGATAPLGDALRNEINKVRTSGTFPMLGAKGSMAIADGALKLDRIKIDSTQSELETTNRIDLAGLLLTSSWTLKPKPAEVDKPALPTVQLIFSGPIANPQAMVLSLDIADLQRDVEARKLLGGTDQFAGLWPVPGEAAEAAILPPEPAPSGQVPSPLAAAVQPSNVGGSLDQPPAPVTNSTSTASPPAEGSANPSDAPATLDPNQPGLADPAKKPLPARRRKKADWVSSLINNLFGN